MYKNLATFIGTQNVFTLKNKMLCALTILIFAACFTTGCDNVSTRAALDVFSTVDLNRTITVTLDEKNGSGITGEATFGEYSIESSVLLSLDVKIQNAGPGRKYAAYIYSGDSCETPGSIWDVEAFKAYSFTTDEDGMGNHDYTTDLTIDTNSETDILGKVLVIHEQVGSGDLADGTQVSCGVITLTE